MNRLLYVREPRWAQIADRIETLMASGAFTVVKDEKRVRAGFIRTAYGDRVFVKRVETRSAVGGWIERLRGSRAQRAVCAAKLLEAAGLHCPAPLAAVELRSRSGAIQVSYLMSEALEDARTLSVFALGVRGELRRDMARRIRITKAVAVEVRRMHHAGLYTRDLQETNLMLAEREAGLAIYFLDLEDFAHARTVSLERRLTNLVHLDRSIGRFLGRAGRLRFLYAYLEPRPARAEIRELLTRLRAMRATIDRRAARRDRGEITNVAGRWHSAPDRS
ncbi:MAG: hypothetical protein IVW54_12585 [Candidatus Binataceae bacterium]|nr:hypothetical protein [Candidatus Binataceae bacterium]